MPDYSSHYNLIELGAGESLSTDDYAFTRGNIKFMDYLLHQGAEGHVHNGDGPGQENPGVAPGVALITGSGSIPGGRTLRYKFTWVDPFGAETAASPEVTINTPSPIATPGTPTVTQSPVGGALLPGNYFYALSAYTSANTLETSVGQRAYVTLLSSNLNSITLGLPSLPSGASGFNVYRRSPGSTRFQYLTSVAMNIATPPSTFVDTGSIAEDCNRTAPSKNTTATNNSVLVTIPGATPTVPAGFTWKIYRTYVAGDYSSSLLHWVVEETSEGSGIVVTSYTDVGTGTAAGQPPATSQMVGSPSKISMTDASDVEGILPTGLLIVPVVIRLRKSGAVVVGNGLDAYVSEFDQLQVISARASLGYSSSAVARDVILDVKYNSGFGWSTLFTAGDLPSVDMGDQLGDKYTLVTNDVQLVASGTQLRLDVIQTGGGATPLDFDPMVTLLCYATVGDDESTHQWALS